MWSQKLLSGAIAATLIGGLQWLGLGATLESLGYIALFRLRGTQSWHGQVVVLGIDRPTVEAFAETGWSRDLYGTLLEALAPHPPQVIGFDILLPGVKPGDAHLAQAIAQSAPVVLGVAWDQHGQLKAPPERLQQAAYRLGHITEFREVQGITQQICSEYNGWPSLSLAIAQIAQPTLEKETQPFWINWSDSLQAIPTYSFWEVAQGKVDPALLADKIVLVGMTVPGFDPVRTPFDGEGSASAVYVHAAIVSNLLQDRTLQPVLYDFSLWQSGFYCLLALGMSWGLARRRDREQLSLGGLGCLLWVGLCLVAFQADYLLPVAIPVLLIGLTTSCSLIYWGTRMRHGLTAQVQSDPVTQLPNRQAFTTQLAQILEQQDRESPPPSVGLEFGAIAIDIERFSTINTHQSHAVGNQVLREIAQRLTHFAQTQPAPTAIARLSADMFILFTPLSDHEPIEALLQRLTPILQHPFTPPSGPELFWHVRLGVALTHASNWDAQQLIRHAEAALYQARLQRQPNYAIFNRELYQGAIALWHLELDLHRTLQPTTNTPLGFTQDLSTSGFYLEYQPIVSLATQKIVGFEALVRWRHPERGILSPLEFIPLAETTGLITLLGQWVLYRACYQLRAWHLVFPQHHDLMMTVNLSPMQLFSPSVISQVQTVLSATGIESHHLKLEITESQLMESGDQAIQLLEQLRYLGICLSLDDFGTGYSSLARLQSLPLDTLKIDRSFVSQLTPERTERTMVHTILDLAEQLKMQVVAEGIETPTQMQILRSLNCDYGQGYLFARPLNVQAVEHLLAQPSELSNFS